MNDTVLDIVKKRIFHGGYDGLFNDCGCGCTLEDLMPCDNNTSNCELAYRFDCDQCRRRDDCEDRQDGCADFMMSPDVDFCVPEYEGAEE